MLMQTFAQLKNTYGAVWEGSVPTAPPLDLQISSSGQQLVLRYMWTNVCFCQIWLVGAQTSLLVWPQLLVVVSTQKPICNAAMKYHVQSIQSQSSLAG